MNVRLWGRFFECEAKRRREVSFLLEKNSRGVTSSKGWIVFFLVNLRVCGFLREFCEERGFSKWEA